MNVFCLITGRGTNTLTNKNVLPVLGRPLVTYPAAQAVKAVDKENCYVSSDDLKILNAVGDFGFRPIVRPAEISQPSSKHLDAITHAVDEIQRVRSLEIDILVVMLANSATVKAEWISESIDRIKHNREITAVVPAYLDQDHHPYRAKRLDDTGKLVSYFDFRGKEISTNRQELPNNYFLSHNFWVLNVKESLARCDGEQPWTFLGKNVQPLFVEDCFDVHDQSDLMRSEAWLLSNGITDEKS